MSNHYNSKKMTRSLRRKILHPKFYTIEDTVNFNYDGKLPNSKLKEIVEYQLKKRYPHNFVSCKTIKLLNHAHVPSIKNWGYYHFIEVYVNVKLRR